MRVFLLFCLMLFPASVWGWTGTVVDVRSGDAVQVRRSGTDPPVVVRMYGVEAPTIRQPFGQQALDRLRELLPVGARINVDPTPADNGTETGLIQIGGMSVNYKLVEEGLAWVRRDTCKAMFCRRWYIQESYAVRAKRGLWSAPHKTPPWQWTK